ncbi:MAG: 2-isopropylmalate synthase [Thermoplasmata archaeon]|nr:2-isopropylmalate synthase [Thermoplasmata archaeon]
MGRKPYPEGTRDKFAVSGFNSAASDGGPRGSVSIFDTTLRDGEQSPGIALNPDDKIAIARALDDLGIDYIEAGFAGSSDLEKDIVRSIGKLGLEATVCTLARSVRADIDAALEADLGYVHTFIATSDIHMRSKLKMSPVEVKAAAVDSIEYARDHGLRVMFSCEDATRSDLAFLKDVCLAAQDAGAECINIPDTVGVIAPKAMGLLVKELCSVLRVPVSVHCHNDLGLALANTLAAVDNGATMVQGTVNGIGERAGNVALEEVAVDLYAFYGIETLDLSKISAVSQTVGRITAFPMAPNKPIVGRNAFSHEAGIHVHGVMNDPATYEPFRPEVVGADRHFVVGKFSGSSMVGAKLKRLGIRFPEERMPELMEAVKRFSVADKEISDAELETIAYDILWKGADAESPCRLEEMTVITGMSTTPTATVKLSLPDGTTATQAETGVGPVDAALNAIRRAMHPGMTLEEYKVSAITGNSDSLCQVVVTLKNVQGDGRLAFGRAIGPDIVQASVDAMMAAINRDYASVRRERREY